MVSGKSSLYISAGKHIMIKRKKLHIDDYNEFPICINVPSEPDVNIFAKSVL